MDDQQSFSSPPPPQQMPQQPQMMVPMGFMPGMRPNQSPGRPNGNPEAQAMRDRQSQAMSELNELLPKQAKETRFHIYRLSKQRGTWIKISSRPDNKIYLSEWKDLGLTETDALRAYLREKLGPGCYQITACDAHGSPMPRTPSWTEDLYQEGDDNMNGHLNDPRARGRGGRGRFRRSDRGEGGRDLNDDGYDDDDEYDDYDDFIPERRGGGGGGIMDFIQTTKAVEGSAAAAAQAAAQTQQASQQDTMRMLMLQSQQQRDADDRRRTDEAAREERRRDERRQEEVRNEERRREDRKEDERRREEERRQDREREERNAQSRTAMISGIITAAVSVLPTMLAPKKDDTMVVLLSKLMEPKPQDPMMATLLAKIMDSGNQKTGIDTMLAGMAKVQEVGAEMQAKQMQSVMNTSQELQGKLMQQVIANLKNSGGEESTFDKILKGLPALLPLVQAASAQQAAQPVAVQQRPVITQAAPAQTPTAPAPQTVAEAQPPMPQGYDLVAKVMIALHTKRYDTETQRSQMLDLLVANAPEDLKHAIARADQPGIMSLCAPTFTANPEYMAWLQSPGAMDFIMVTAGGLQPQFAAQLGYELEPAAAEPAPAPAPAPLPVAVEPTATEKVHDAVVVTNTPDVG